LNESSLPEVRPAVAAPAGWQSCLGPFYLPLWLTAFSRSKHSALPVIWGILSQNHPLNFINTETWHLPRADASYYWRRHSTKRPRSSTTAMSIAALWLWNTLRGTVRGTPTTHQDVGSLWCA
jgi:hypothetical protein